MTNYILPAIAVLFFNISNVNSQAIKLEKNMLQPVNVFMRAEKLGGVEVIKVVKDSSLKEVDEPTFVKIKGVDFSNGTIEIKVQSKLLKNAPAFARGFIGIAFRINDSNTNYESIYLRPTNARADDQVRRNHSIQYYSYPDFKFDRLRKEAPERYESYSDMEMEKWITMRIEVKGTQAKLYLDNNKQPSLIVNDLKLGADAKGGIGLWVDIGTEGYFTGLQITNSR
ncbi:MAG: hypothetical protein V4717_24170 [Bacteroidota bacterium]